MQSFIKCYDAVSVVIDEATIQFAPLLKENKEKRKILEQYCDAIDTLAKQFNAIEFGATVDETKTTVEIEMVCPEMALRSNTHAYYALAEKAVTFGFSVSNDGDIVVRFEFPSLWEKAV